MVKASRMKCLTATLAWLFEYGVGCKWKKGVIIFIKAMTHRATRQRLKHFRLAPHPAV